MMGPDLPKMATSRETYGDEHSQELCLQCPSPTMNHSHPLFSQEILQELQSGPTQIPMEPAFALFRDSAYESLCLPFKSGVSVFPNAMELLHTSPTGL